MKKITLSILFAFACVVGFGQNVIIERPNDNGTGLIATEGNDGTGVYCADYFEITDEIAIGSVKSFGFSSSGFDISPLVTGWNVFIFEDFSGVPGGDPEVGGEFASVADVAPGDFMYENDGGNQADFTLEVTAANGNSQIVLPPGNYWYCAFPTVDSPPAGDGRWNWTGSLNTDPAVQPVLIDPADLFGAGATNWANISTLIGADFPSFGWTLIDEPIELSVGDELADVVSVYPNPATSVVNIKTPASVQIEGAVLTDVLGRSIQVVVNNGQFDVSNLASGTYVLNIATNEGNLAQTIVKN